MNEVAEAVKRLKPSERRNDDAVGEAARLAVRRTLRERRQTSRYGRSCGGV